MKLNIFDDYLLLQILKLYFAIEILNPEALEVFIQYKFIRI